MGVKNLRTTTATESPAAYGEVPVNSQVLYSLARGDVARTVLYAPGANPFWKLEHYPNRVFPEPSAATGYVDYAEFEQGIDRLVDEHGDMLRYRSVGESPGWLDREARSTAPKDVWVVELTNDVRDRESFAEKQKLVVTLGIHGDERSGAEAGMRLVEDVVSGDAESVASALDDVALVFLFPNPDGWAAKSPLLVDGRFRDANTFKRSTATGNDPNRQYPTPAGSTRRTTRPNPAGGICETTERARRGRARRTRRLHGAGARLAGCRRTPSVVRERDLGRRPPRDVRVRDDDGTPERKPRVRLRRRARDIRVRGPAPRPTRRGAGAVALGARVRPDGGSEGDAGGVRDGRTAAGPDRTVRRRDDIRRSRLLDDGRSRLVARTPGGGGRRRRAVGGLRDGTRQPPPREHRVPPRPPRPADGRSPDGDRDARRGGDGGGRRGGGDAGRRDHRLRRGGRPARVVGGPPVRHRRRRDDGRGRRRTNEHRGVGHRRSRRHGDADGHRRRGDAQRLGSRSRGVGRRRRRPARPLGLARQDVRGRDARDEREADDFVRRERPDPRRVDATPDERRGRRGDRRRANDRSDRRRVAEPADDARLRTAPVRGDAAGRRRPLPVVPRPFGCGDDGDD
ncbi:hypothetical protein GJ632_11270 [Halogeometricum sp. CBA1124]|nr:hypothetical protein [Halogeometricum sp. CBA1124]